MTAERGGQRELTHYDMECMRDISQVYLPSGYRGTIVENRIHFSYPGMSRRVVVFDVEKEFIDVPDESQKRVFDAFSRKLSRVGYLNGVQVRVGK